MKMENQYRQKNWSIIFWQPRNTHFLFAGLQLTYFATIFVPGDGFLRQSATNPIFGAVVESSLLAFPTAPWSTQPAAVSWDALKTAREPVLGRSANPVFFRRGSRKKSCSGSFFATSWAGRRVCSDMQLTARLRRKRAATAKPINWRRNRKTSLVHSTHGFHQ